MGQVDLVNLDAGPVGRATFLPGWKWSDHVKPIAKTDSCMASHTGYTISGRIKVVMDDGEELEFGPGDFGVIPPGHDAWVLGDEPYVYHRLARDGGLRQAEGVSGGTGMQKAPDRVSAVRGFSYGGGTGTRTPNPLLAKQVRYQLRHAPIRSNPTIIP